MSVSAQAGTDEGRRKMRRRLDDDDVRDMFELPPSAGKQDRTICIMAL